MWKQWFKGVRALKLDEPEVTSWHQYLVVGRDQAVSKGVHMSLVVELEKGMWVLWGQRCWCVFELECGQIFSVSFPLFLEPSLF